MTTKTLSTGSAGNCYLLTADSGQALILDCGIPVMEIKRGLNFNLRKVAGCIISHGHKDHSASADRLEQMGLPVWRPYLPDTPQNMRFGEFTVQAFKLPHNGTENRGFYIKADGQRLLYMTDFEYCPFTFRKQRIQHFLIECNYDKNSVSRDLPNYEHKILGHAELQTVKGIIEANKTPDLRTVVLCHMGADTLNTGRALKEITEAAGLGTNILFARTNNVVELNEVPF